MAEQFNSQQLLLSRSIAKNISAYFNLLQEEVLSLSNILTRTNLKGRADFEWFVEEVLRRKSDIKAHFGILDKGGKVLFFEPSGGKVERVAPALSEVGRKLEFGKAEIFSTPSQVYVVTQARDSWGEHRTAFFSVNVEDVATYFIGNIKSGATGHASIIDRQGNLLYHHPSSPEMSGKNVYNADATCFKCHGSFDLEKRILEGKEKEFDKYMAPAGEDKIMAFAYAEAGALSWIITVSAPYSEVTFATKESMKLYSYLIISILTTTVVVSGLLIFFNKKRIQAEEIEKREEQMRSYAVELEEKVRTRTEELSSEKEKLDTIVGAMGSGIVLFDKQGIIQWANHMIREMAGKDVVGMSCEQLCAECDIAGAYSSPDRIETVIMTNLFGRADRYFQVITAPVKGEDGDVHGHIRLIQDVTEMKRLEEQMSNSEKLASIGRLAAGIAHEIGNPLTSIFSFVQILREVEQDEFKKDSLNTIYFHINRISEILKQLSGFTKMPISEPRVCKVNDIIDTSLNLIQYDKKAREISVVRELSPEMPAVSCDSNQLSQVFVNLILNAVDAMPQGGTLTVRSAVKEAAVVIEFEDTGSGISKENLTKIFDPFYTTKEKGTGLGLAVSYNIVKKMNGTLTVESEPNKGTTFTITMPLDGRDVVHES
jgi:PAS domain S-box-containing protein